MSPVKSIPKNTDPKVNKEMMKNFIVSYEKKYLIV